MSDERLIDKLKTVLANSGVKHDFIGYAVGEIFRLFPPSVPLWEAHKMQSEAQAEAIAERDSLRAQLQEAERERDHWRDGIDRIGEAIGVPEHQDEIGVVDRAEQVVADLTAARARADALEGEAGAMRSALDFYERELSSDPVYDHDGSRWDGGDRARKALSGTAGKRAAEVIAAARNIVAVWEDCPDELGEGELWLRAALAALDGGGESK